MSVAARKHTTENKTKMHPCLDSDNIHVTYMCVKKFDQIYVVQIRLLRCKKHFSLAPFKLHTYGHGRPPPNTLTYMEHHDPATPLLLGQGAEVVVAGEQVRQEGALHVSRTDVLLGPRPPQMASTAIYMSAQLAHREPVPASGSILFDINLKQL